MQRKRTAHAKLKSLQTRYELREQPLEQADARLFPEKENVLRAWRLLTGKHEADTGAFGAMELILRATSPAPREHNTTAAGFSGGRRGPRRPDMWISLLGAQNMETVGVHGARRCDPLLKPARFSRGWPLDFVTRLLPALKNRSGSAESAVDARSLLAHYWRLSLHESETLLAATACLVASTEASTALEWLDVLTLQPPERRETFLTVLLETKAYEHSPPAWLSSHSQEFNALVKDDLHAYRLLVVLSPDGYHCRPEYLMAGFRLANRFARKYPFSYVESRGQSDAATSDALLKLFNYLKGANGFYDEYPVRFWENSARLPGINDLIKGLNWYAFSRDTALDFVGLFNTCPEGSWELLRENAEAVQADLLSLPSAYRAAAVKLLTAALELQTREVIDQGFRSTRLLMQRLCKPPFSPLTRELKPGLAFIFALPGRLRDLPAQCGDNSLKALEKACSSWNRADLVSAGLGAMARAMPDFTVDCFRDFPARLMKSAELLGTFSSEIIQATLERFRGSPIMLNFENEGCLDLDRLRRWAYPRLFNPLPTRLLAHFRGEKQLNPRALNADLEKAHRDIALLRLEVLDEMIRARLAMGITEPDSRTEFMEHSLRMARSIDSNIRMLKRFLRARAQGRSDFVADHPGNRAWRYSHPEISMELWRSGVSIQRTLTDGRAVNLSVEQDPDEILKMGTHFDTCLGLGGVNAFSAAAVLLDENKQVVYARDRAGRPLGRQLLAICEAGRLVCFHVYSAPGLREQMLDLFQYYDQLFARRLGLPLHDNSDAEYEIRLLVAEEWYDDGAWVPAED